MDSRSAGNFLDLPFEGGTLILGICIAADCRKDNFRPADEESLNQGVASEGSVRSLGPMQSFGLYPKPSVIP